MRGFLFGAVLLCLTTLTWAQSLPWLPPPTPSGGTVAASTWDATYNPQVCPSPSTACSTFSGGNLIWTCTHCSGGFQTNARGTNNHTSGKWYFEMGATTVGSTTYMVGLSNVLVANNSNIFASNTGVGYNSAGTVATNFPTVLATLSSYTSGDTICVAADLSNLLIWYQKAGSGTWNPGIAGANPATGVGGINLAGIPPPMNVYPAGAQGFSADVMTLNVTTASGCTKPAGFNFWG